MTIHKRKHKLVEFSLGTNPNDIAFECQLNTWSLNNNTEDGDKIYTLCPTGEDREETDPDYSLDVTFYSDWREDGISDYLWAHDGELQTFVLDHHPDIPAEHVRWTGQLTIKAPNVGGEARTTETTEATFLITGKPTYTRIEESS